MLRLNVVVGHLQRCVSTGVARPLPTAAAESSTRLEVLSLLQQAKALNESPSRSSTSAFTAKTTMADVAACLLRAYELEPTRVDLLISAANAQIYDGRLDDAIELLNRALQVAPSHLDANSYLCVWSLVKRGFEDHDADGFLEAVRRISPARAMELTDIVDRVRRIIGTPLKDSMDPGSQAIVTLGYKMNEDGSMSDILIARLKTTLRLALAHPGAKLLMTGGLAINGLTESNAMASWLLARGVSRDRLLEEAYARNTIENALYSAQILAAHRIERATVVSSAGHLRRGQACLEVACAQVCGPHFSVDAACDDAPSAAAVGQRELMGICHNALRVSGMWMFASDPLRER